MIIGDSSISSSFPKIKGYHFERTENIMETTTMGCIGVYRGILGLRFFFNAKFWGLPYWGSQY